MMNNMHCWCFHIASRPCFFFFLCGVHALHTWPVFLQPSCMQFSWPFMQVMSKLVNSQFHTGIPFLDYSSLISWELHNHWGNNGSLSYSIVFFFFNLIWVSGHLPTNQQGYKFTSNMYTAPNLTSVENPNFDADSLTFKRN